MGISRDKAHKRRSTGGKHKRIRMKRKYEMGRQPANTKIGEKKITQVRVRGGNFKYRALRLDNGNYCWPGESVTRKTRILKVVYNSTNNELVRTNTLVKGSIIQIDSTPFKAWYLQYYNIDLSNKKEIALAVDKKLLAKEKEEKPAGKKGAAEKPKKEEKAPEKGKKEEKPAAKKQTAEKPEEKGKKPEEKGKKPEKKTEKKPEKKPEEKKSEKKSERSEKKPVSSSAKIAKTEKGKQKTTTDDKRKNLSKSQNRKFSYRNSKRVLEPLLADQFKTGRLYAKISSRPGQSGRCDGYILEGEELAFYLKKLNLKKKKT